MILSGEKKEEYRVIKPHWCQILLNRPFSFMSETPKDVLKDLDACPRGVFKDFDTVTFSNGYAKNRPQFVIELKSIEVGQGYPHLGAIYRKTYFILKLGKIIDKVG